MRLCSFTFVLLLVTCLSAHGATLEAKNGVRFDAVATDSGYTLAARGRPGQSTQEVQAAFDLTMKTLCPEAKVLKPPTQSEYEYLEGGVQFLMPAGGALIPMTTYSVVRAAPAISGSVTCSASESGLSARIFRLSIESRLSESVSYIDQGFASFNREQMDVPLTTGTLAETVAQAIKSALLERGYNVELSAPGDASAARLVIRAARVPGERFEGIAMLTKIGLLGITNLSAAFCSFEVAVIPNRSSTPQVAGGVSTRELTPAIYSSWKQDMMNGPSIETHSKVSALLTRTLATNVRAAIHALPTKTLDLLFTVQAE